MLDLDYVHPTGARDDFRDNWGGDDLDALSRYDGLQAIRITALGRSALALTDTYQTPACGKDAQGLKVLPDLDIVATGVLSTGDQLLLSAFAEHTADRVWSVSAASLLAAINTGRDPTDFAAFLAQRTAHELSDGERHLRYRRPGIEVPYGAAETRLCAAEAAHVVAS